VEGTLNALGVVLLTATEPHHAYVVGGATEPTPAQHATIPSDDGDSDSYEMINNHLDWIHHIVKHSDWRFGDLFSLCELHELCHWALGEEKSPHSEGTVDDHSKRWNRTLINQLEYITERELPRQIEIDHSRPPSVMQSKPNSQRKGEEAND
jgi:hypothetical protein